MDIHLVTTDDWQGLYIDGCMAHQGHTVSAWDVLNILEDEFGFKLYYTSVPMQDMDKYGASFPNLLNELEEANED